VSSSTVDTGIVGRMCPQANPLWLGDLAYNFVVDYLSGEEYTGPTSVSSSSYTPGPHDPRITEDCLFLDVLTPQSIFNSETASAAVIVWIYGGGYTEGDKSFYNGTSLILRNIVDGGEGFVYVGINYRVRSPIFLSVALSRWPI
jgi:carboxylesterase type B